MILPLIRTFRIILVAALALGLAASAARGAVTNQTKSLTIRECVERALENNLEIRAQRINPTIATWGVVGAQGVYDPLLSGAFNYVDSTTPAEFVGVPTNGLLSTTPVKEQQLQSSGTLSGLLPSGATYGLSATDTRYSGNTRTNFLYAGTAGISGTQPLLKNFGFGVNAAIIRIARESKTIAIQNFVQFVMTKISTVSTAYYELVYAIENHKAAVENRELARQLLDENRKREQVGTMSPLDVIQAEAGVAESEQNVITTAQTIKDNENTLKRLICQQVTEFRGTSLVPVDYPIIQMIALDVDECTRTALQMRADYLSALHSLEQQNITVQFDRNQIWPQLDLQGSYGLNGSGRTFGGMYDNLASGNNPVWSVGVVASFPLGDRRARSTYHIARLDADQLLLSLKSLEQDIVVGVDTAVGHVEANLKSVEAARAATRLAQESLDAEKKKLLAGTSTTFLVLQAQSQLATARSAQIRAEADYSESLVALDLAEGTILQKNNIVLDEKF
jgi:outer membrane protein TolC